MKTVREMLDGKPQGLATTAPGTSVLDATRHMADKGIGALLVTEGDELIGLISERDVAFKLVCVGDPAEQTPVRAIMSTEVFCVTPGQTVEECMALMTEKRIRHLPVKDAGRLIGVISIGDAVKAIISEQQFLIEQLENYITA